jgi:hypothetical protein
VIDFKTHLDLIAIQIGQKQSAIAAAGALAAVLCCGMLSYSSEHGNWPTGSLASLPVPERDAAYRYQ